jgi:predicted amidohydrolase YtcJ
MRKRASFKGLLLAGVCFWQLAGCSSSSDSYVITADPPRSALAPLPITDQTTAAVAAAVLMSGDVDFLLPVEASTIPGRDSLPSLNSSHPNSSALALASTVFRQGPGHRESSLGGSWTVTDSGQGLQAEFRSLNTLVGTVDGRLRVVPSGPDAFAVEFEQLQISTRDAATTLDGPASYRRDQVPNGGAVSWTANYQLTTPQGVIDLQDFLVETTFVLDGDHLAGSKILQGHLTVSAQGQAGTLQVQTTTPLSFTGTFTGRRSDLALGSGTLSIMGDNTIALSAGPAGVALSGPEGSRLKTVPWSYLGGSLGAANLARPLVADTIFHNATFLTVDAQGTQAEALASMDGRLLVVGTLAQAQQFAEAGTRMIDLGGATVAPGFVEPHVHTNLTALNSMSEVTPLVVDTGTYNGLNSKANSLAALTAAVNSSANPAAVFGYGFDPARLIPAELLQPLTLTELDGVSETVPIVVQNSSGHISYVNSAAFRATKIWPTAPDGPFTPPPGVNGIVVGPDGLPTGQLNEAAQNPFIGLAFKGIVEPLGTAFEQQFLTVLGQFAQNGVTSVGDMLTGAVLTLAPEEEILSRLALDSSPVVRMQAYLDTQTIEPTRSNVFAGEGTDEFRIQGAKFTLDGSTQGLTAALNFNYQDAVTPYLPGPPNGTLDIPDDAQLFQQMSAWHALGFQIASHANGDRALEQAFRMYSSLPPRPDARFRVEHFTVHTDAELPGHVARAKELGVYVSMTIGHVFFWGQVFHDTILPSEVADNIDPSASLLQGGVPISFHSDSPISPAQPLRYIQTAVTRVWQTPVQQILNPDERISREQALKAVTLDAAATIATDHKVGSLEVGKYADLVVLGANPLTVPEETIADIPVLATYVGGELKVQP